VKASTRKVAMTRTAATVHDPAGLIAQVAELEPLCADPLVRHAVASGDPFKVYRSLWWARATFRLRAHRDTLRALLRSRRVFAKPEKEGNYGLGSTDGLGVGLVGRDERDDDGTLIKTRVMEFLGIPVFPLSAHVVSVRQEFGEIVKVWFYARVPLGTGWWLWRCLWTGLAAAAVAASAWSALEAWLRSSGS
jgi:hypothetical protein